MNQLLGVWKKKSYPPTNERMISARQWYWRSRASPSRFSLSIVSLSLVGGYVLTLTTGFRWRHGLVYGREPMRDNKQLFTAFLSRRHRRTKKSFFSKNGIFNGKNMVSSREHEKRTRCSSCVRRLFFWNGYQIVRPKAVPPGCKGAGQSGLFVLTNTGNGCRQFDVENLWLQRWIWTTGVDAHFSCSGL